MLLALLALIVLLHSPLNSDSQKQDASCWTSKLQVFPKVRSLPSFLPPPPAAATVAAIAAADTAAATAADPFREKKISGSFWQFPFLLSSFLFFLLLLLSSSCSSSSFFFSFFFLLITLSLSLSF